MKSLLDAMREETTQLHRALHVHPLLLSCQKGTMNKEEYRHLLAAFYSPWKLLIPAIDLVPIRSLIPKLHHRAQAIHDDLDKLHVDQVILDSRSLNTIPGQAEILGMCYVLIGSSMGASMLSTKIKETLHDVPVSYLSMTPKEAGWPELLGELRSIDALDYADATKSACDTFELMGKELSKVITESIPKSRET